MMAMTGTTGERSESVTVSAAAVLIEWIGPVAPDKVPWMVAEHLGAMILSSSSVTGPPRASTRPATVTPVLIVMEPRARMVPVKVELAPSVAEPATCQKTLQALALLTNVTELDGAVTRSDLAWKIHTASGSLWASSVSPPARLSGPPPSV